MANGGGTQPELLVEFAGLCLYVGDPKNNHVTILMPDARQGAKPLHQDGEEGQPHVGYIRFDLANLDVDGIGTVHPGPLDDGSGSPPNEIIHRFDRHQLTFDFVAEDRDGGKMAIDIGVPNFNKFAPSLEAIPHLLTTNPPEALLMRTRISGGSIKATGLGKTWEFSSVLSPARPKQSYRGQFAGFALWRRPIKARKVTITISDFAGKPVLQIPLKTRTIDGKEVIAIKVANLCSHNPLEWGEFPIRSVVKHDLDFKWLYRLLTPKGEKFDTVLAGAELPFPRAMPNQAFGDEDCMGGYIETPFK
jgi:hypothetical protein